MSKREVNRETETLEKKTIIGKVIIEIGKIIDKILGMSEKELQDFGDKQIKD